MRYTVLNRLYWESLTWGAMHHYGLAMKNRGWVPEPYDVLFQQREALEERGRATKTNSQEPDPIRVTPLGKDWRATMLDKDWWLNPPGLF